MSDLENLARQAGEILRAGYGHVQHIEFKSLIDPVTEVDHQSEAYLVGEIQRRFPNHRIITEESGQMGDQECCTWFIDPLDGTVNFSHGVPQFAVSIGYQEGSDLRLGVVYDPLRGECFTAERGRGVWLNGRPIHVSKQTDKDKSLLVTGFPYDIRTNPSNNMDNYARLSMLFQAVRRFGSASLDLCYVAAGRFEGFWELTMSAWDIAAGALIAAEAGAVVSDVNGNRDFFRPPYSIAVANPWIHPLMLEALNKSKKRLSTDAGTDEFQ